METQYTQPLSSELVSQLRVALEEEFGIAVSLEESASIGSAWLMYLEALLTAQRKPPD